MPSVAREEYRGSLLIEDCPTTLYVVKRLREVTNRAERITISSTLSVLLKEGILAAGYWSDFSWRFSRSSRPLPLHQYTTGCYIRSVGHNDELGSRISSIRMR